MLGAILVVASEGPHPYDDGGISRTVGNVVPMRTCPEAGETEANPVRSGAFSAVPLACIEVLGRSTLDRTVDLFRSAVGDAISVIGDNRAIQKPDHTFGGVSFGEVSEPWDAALRILKRQREDGIRTTFVMRVGAYVEFDPFTMFQFHMEQRQGLTRAYQQKEFLDLWVVNTAEVGDESDISQVLQAADSNGAFYPLPGYVNHLSHPRDLRRLASDSFASVCRMRPQGKEIRSRVWMEYGAQVSRKARIVGPAFIGRGSKVREHAVITRGSNVEKNSEIDYGTVVEDSSVCAGSYVGLCLDVAHSVVNGSNLFNLERDMMLQISDPGVIRERKPAPGKDLTRTGTFARTWADRLVDSAIEFNKVS